MTATLHLALALLAGGLDVALLATLGSAAVRHSVPRLFLDRLILAIEAAVGLGLLVGLVQLGSGRSPADPLHFLYAAIALIALPIGRGWRGIEGGPRVVPLGVAAIVLGGVLVRLAQTGGT